jgi:hypothetical protein
LDPAYKILTHKIIEDQIRNFIASHNKSEQESIKKQIITTYRKLKSDPTGPSNVPFHENRNPAFIGKIRKIYIGGKERYRLLNICLPEKKIILPLYFSASMRRDFDYDKVNWLEIAEEIYKDFVKENLDKFSQF